MAELHTIENEKIRVTVCDHGAELFSLYDKENDRETVWQADPAYWNRHAPVLFPFVGKVNGGFYTHEGKNYEMGQHGFARDMEFTFVSADEDSITHELRATEETLKKYPFEFILRITHKISDRTLSVCWEVENPSAKALYFSIGGHPAFNVPAKEGTKKTEYFVTFGGQKKLTYVLIDPATNGVDAEHPRTLELKDNQLPVTEHLFDGDALIFDDGQVEKVGIAFPDGSPYLTMECKGFPSLGVWSKPHSDAPYICLEPWIGRCDNSGFAGELKDKYAEQKLEAGQTFHAQYRVTLG